MKKIIITVLSLSYLMFSCGQSNVEKKSAALEQPSQQALLDNSNTKIYEYTNTGAKGDLAFLCENNNWFEVDIDNTKFLGYYRYGGGMKKNYKGSVNIDGDAYYAYDKNGDNSKLIGILQEDTFFLIYGSDQLIPKAISDGDKLVILGQKTDNYISTLTRSDSVFFEGDKKLAISIAALNHWH